MEQRIAGEVDPQRHRVDEVADHARPLRRAAAGGRGPHGEAVVPGVAPELRLEGGEQSGEEGCPLGGGQPP